MDKASNKLGTEKVFKLLISLAIPSIVAQLVNVVYNIVDRIYIGRMEDGALAMSGLAVSLPVVTIVMGFSMLFGTGGAPLAAIKMGEKDIEGANKILTNSFACLTISGVVLTAVFLIFLDPILYVFGADSTSIGYARDYVGIYAIGNIFVHLSFGLNAYITTQGFAKFSMATVIIGAGLNIVLDPLFIFVFDMGVSGAALATIISQAVSAIWVLMFFMGKKSTLKIKKEYIMPSIKIVLSITALGVSPFIMCVTESLLQITFNNQLLLYGGTLAVGTMAILSSTYSVLNMTLTGLSQGAQPIMSYNFGAKNYTRVRKTFKLLVAIAFGYKFIAVILIVIFPTFFASFYTSDPDSLRMASWALVPYLFGSMVAGLQSSCQQSFLALGQAKRSLLMALNRKIILLIPLIYILPALIGDTQWAIDMAAPVADLVHDPGRVFSVLFAESVADVLASLSTFTLFMFFYKKHLTKADGT